MAEPVRHPETRFEPSDVSLRLVGRLAAGLGAAIVGLPLLILLVYPDARKDTPNAPSALPAAPPLQTQPASDLALHRAVEAQRLASWGWVDRAAGRVHMPIDEAMRRVARDGIADWPGAAARPATARAGE